ncbi:MAG TPA: tRNA (cytidine(34)-2'-O)-methyltransferase [Burkholderiales bacterium]|nr:tRNA (cytidine(34)-2'-O)-methyltransferase [Burkholderiales bacterium]
MPCQIVLFEPEIPPNTGNIMRLCANTGARLHLVGPLGFRLSNQRLRRAGLDYRDAAAVTVHRSWASCRNAISGPRWFAVTTKAGCAYDEIAYRPGDVLLFGPESRGLPPELLAEFAPEARLRIPMVSGSRSLNLANAVAVVVYEVWRQQGFGGAAPR